MSNQRYNKWKNKKSDKKKGDYYDKFERQRNLDKKKRKVKHEST